MVDSSALASAVIDRAYADYRNHHGLPDGELISFLTGDDDYSLVWFTLAGRKPFSRRFLLSTHYLEIANAMR